MVGILAAGFGHVGAAAAGAAYLFRYRADDLAGLQFGGEVFGDSDDDGDFSVFLGGAEDNDSGT